MASLGQSFINYQQYLYLKKMDSEQKKQHLFTSEEYDLHCKQLDSIKKEIEEQDKDIITAKLELQQLESEYFDNQGFLQKIQKIRQTFPLFRRVRRDGSCFYRAVLFRIFERIIETKNQQLSTTFHELIKKSKDELKAVGYDDLVIDDFQQVLLDKLKLCPAQMSVPDAIKVFCDKMDSDYLIMYMRMLTSGYIKTNSFMFEGYIETETVDQFCQQEVDPIDKEADQIQIMALINYINIPIRIYYLDGNVGNQDATIFQIPEDSPADSVFINLLYRPGHYDILYQE